MSQAFQGDYGFGGFRSLGACGFVQGLCGLGPGRESSTLLAIGFRLVWLSRVLELQGLRRRIEGQRRPVRTRVSGISLYV